MVIRVNQVADSQRRRASVRPEIGGDLMEKIKLGISTCLLGENVRYDGGHKLDRFLTDTLGQI